MHNAAAAGSSGSVRTALRRFRTTYEIFADLKRSCEAQRESERDGGGTDGKRRRPVCLFLGGGMAAGKSTVREIIGKDVFWSNVSFNLFEPLVSCMLPAMPLAAMPVLPVTTCRLVGQVICPKHGGVAIDTC